MLVILSGLPGTGKSTLARGLAGRLDAVLVRIDTIEQTLRDARGGADVGEQGYRVGYAVAADNLRTGATVIADSVNPLAVTRRAWRGVAERAAAPFVDVEVVCSDSAEHRRRVEDRGTDIPGLRLPSWADVTAREYEPWTEPRLLIDTAGRTPEACLDDLEGALSG